MVDEDVKPVEGEEKAPEAVEEFERDEAGNVVVDEAGNPVKKVAAVEGVDAPVDVEGV